MSKVLKPRIKILKTNYEISRIDHGEIISFSWYNHTRLWDGEKHRRKFKELPLSEV